MIDEIVESLGEAAVEKATGAAQAVVETVGESVVDIVDMAADVVMPDRQESSEEHESVEPKSDSEDSET